MRGLVITSKGEHDFSELIGAYCRPLSKLVFQRFEAIFPSAIDEKYSHQFYENYSRKPMLGEFGCYLSHTTLWGLNQKDSAIVVLEDDAICGKQFDIDKVIAYCGGKEYPLIVKLGVSKISKAEQWVYHLVKPAIPVKCVSGKWLCRDMTLNTDGTVGYVINGIAMRLLSGEVRDRCVGMLADDWKLLHKLGVKIMSVRPFYVFEDEATKSSIDSQKTRSRSLQLNLRTALKILAFSPVSLPLIILIVVTRFFFL